MAGKNDTSVNQNPSSSHCCDDKVSNKRFDDHIKWMHIIGGIFATVFSVFVYYCYSQFCALENKYLNDHDHLSRLSRIESTYQSDHDKLIVLETRINSKFQK